MNELLFIAIPYLAVAVCVLGTIVRFRSDRFSITTHSTQFIENRWLFWGSNAWHWGILLILAAHVAPLIAPHWWQSLLGEPTRLYILEVTGYGLAFLAAFGLAVLILRRLLHEGLLKLTSNADWLLLVVLGFQVATGIWVAVGYRWGGAWYSDTAVPWLRSLFTLQPDIDTIVAMPWPVKLHAVTGFALLVLLPYTRLIHALTYPVAYLWRPYQLVLWNRRATRPYQPVRSQQPAPRRPAPSQAAGTGARGQPDERS
jgi:nitrate reductase gamma subunit